jgi:hypothetical protein
MNVIRLSRSQAWPPRLLQSKLMGARHLPLERSILLWRIFYHTELA